MLAAKCLGFLPFPALLGHNQVLPSLVQLLKLKKTLLLSLSLYMGVWLLVSVGVFVPLTFEGSLILAWCSGLKVVRSCRGIEH